MQHWINSVLVVVGVFLTALIIDVVYAHQSSAYVGGHSRFSSYFGKNHHLPNIVPMRKTISLPRHVPILKHVSLPLPYPVFQHQQIPMYKPMPVKMDQIVRIPIKIPKYYSVPVHKIVPIPQYVGVSVEVPIYKEIIVRRPIEVPVPVYIKKPTRHTDVSHSVSVQEVRPNSEKSTTFLGEVYYEPAPTAANVQHVEIEQQVPQVYHAQELHELHHAQSDQSEHQRQLIRQAQHLVDTGHLAGSINTARTLISNSK